MASELLHKTGNQFLFADHATDFGAAPATANNSLILGTPDDVQMDMGALAAGSAWQSAKFNFAASRSGSLRARLWALEACIEFASAPADGEQVAWFINYSPSATAAQGNKGGASGADAAFTETIGIRGQLSFIGFLSLRANVINIGSVGIIQPEQQYGSLVALNQAGTPAFATVADEIHATLTEIVDEAQ